MITPDEQHQTVHHLEWLTHVTGHLLLALALLALLQSQWPLVAVVLLVCASTGGVVGWLRREQPARLTWYVIGGGALLVLIWTVLQTWSTPMTFDGVLGLLGRLLAGLAACQAFERPSVRSSTMRQTIAFVLLAVAATTVLREQPLWSLGAPVLFLLLWVFARRSALLLEPLQHGPLTLVNFSPRRYRWLGQVTSSAVAFTLIGACAALAFWQTPHVPLPSIPALKGPFGTFSSGDNTPQTEDQSIAGYLESELMETLQEVGRARNLEQVDQMRQQANGLITFMEEQGKVEMQQLELLRKFSDNLAKRRVRQIAKQSTPQAQQQQARQTPAQQHQQAFQEETQFIGQVLPVAAQALQAAQQQLQQSATAAQVQQAQQQLNQAAQALPNPVSIETPAVQQLIEQLVRDQQQALGVAEAQVQVETDELRQRFQQTVRELGAMAQRQVQPQPAETAWQQHTEALLESKTMKAGLAEAAALMQMLAQAVDRQQLTPEQTGALAQQLDLAVELRTEIERQELRAPDLQHPGRLTEQMAATAQALQEAQQQLAQAAAPSAAAEAAREVRLLEAQQALQQAAQQAQQAAVQIAVSGGGAQAIQQAVADLAAATSAAEARQAAAQLQAALDTAHQATPAASRAASAELQEVRAASTDLLRQQLRVSSAKSQIRLYLYQGHENLWGRPYIFFAIDVHPTAAPTTSPNGAAP